MKIGPDKFQCDGCDKMILPEDVKNNAFYTTSSPLICAQSELTKEEAIKRIPAVLILCLDCEPKMAMAFKMHMAALLPPGRLKQIVTRLVMKYGWERVKFY